MTTATERNELRRKAYELYLAGETAYGIHKALGVSVQTASNWVKRFAERGEAGIAEGKRGPASNPRAALSVEERAALSRLIESSSSLGFDTGTLNDTRTFGELLHRVFGVDVSPRSVRRWMHRFGLRPGVAAVV